MKQRFMLKKLVQYLPTYVHKSVLYYDGLPYFSLIHSRFISIVSLFFGFSTFYRMKTLSEMTASHMPRQGCYCLFYFYLSVSLNSRIRLSCWNPIGNFVDSLSFLYPSSIWSEREIFDLFGVYFENHPDLRRLLTDYGFVNHPLRKDFALSGYEELFYFESLKGLSTVRSFFKPIKSIE